MYKLQVLSAGIQTSSVISRCTKFKYYQQVYKFQVLSAGVQISSIISGCTNFQYYQQVYKFQVLSAGVQISSIISGCTNFQYYQQVYKFQVLPAGVKKSCVISRCETSPCAGLCFIPACLGRAPRRQHCPTAAGSSWTSRLTTGPPCPSQRAQTASGTRRRRTSETPAARSPSRPPSAPWWCRAWPPP